MIRWIVGASLRFRLLVVAAAVGVMVLGATQLRSMPIDVLPEYAPPTVEVQTEAPGLSAHEIETLVSTNLEELLNGTPWLESIRSSSVPGLSSVVLTFKPGTDVLRARALVNERLTLAYTLPNVSKVPTILPPLSANGRVMTIALSSRTVSLLRMGVLTRWNIRPALMAVPGVANVAVWGQREDQLQVQVEPEQLLANHLALDRIVSTTGDAMWLSPLSYLSASTPGTGGWVDTPQQRLEVRHVLPFSGPAGLARVRIDGSPLRLGDVAQVVENHQPLIGDAVLRSGGHGMLLVVEKMPNANTLAVTRGVQRALTALQPGLHGIQIDSNVFRPATYIHQSIHNLTRSLLIGALLVVLVLGAFLFEWRAALISLVAIMASLAAATVVLDWRGASVNTMMIAGFVIALGVIVDDAVIDSEQIIRRLRAQRAAGSDRSLASTILEASSEIRGLVVYGTLIVILPLLPVFFARGVSGALLQPLALSYALAVVASLLVALTVTPALSLVLFPRMPRDRESPVVVWLQRAYAGALSAIVHRPRPVLLGAAATALAGLAVLPFLGQEMLPSFRDTSIVAQVQAPPGTSLPEMTRITARATREISSIPGVRDAGADIGRAVQGDQVDDVNSAQIWISVDPSADYDRTVAAIRDTVDGYPGLHPSVSTYVDSSVRRVLTDNPQATVVRVYGAEFGRLARAAAAVKRAISGIHGVTDVRAETSALAPEVDIRTNLARAARYGIKPGDVRRAAATFLAGLEVGSLFKQQKVFSVVVWSTPDTRRGLTAVGDLLIDSPTGQQVPLKDVADVTVVPTPTVIRHDAVSRMIDVGFDTRGRDLGSAVAAVKQRLAHVAFPLETRAEVVGDYSAQQAADYRMIGAGIAAAVGIFLLLQAAFASWRLATLAFLTLPAALAGGAIAAYLSGDPVSLGSLVGFLAILGIAARNGILLIGRYRQLEREGLAHGRELALRGARDRVVPIVTTALTTGLALTPLVVSGAIAGQEIAQPIAVIVLGGLVTSTLLNLFVMPVLYLRFGSRSRPAASA